MKYKEEIKMKPIMSFIICLVFFSISINHPASIALLMFSIYFLFNSITAKTIELTDEITVSFSFKKVRIHIQDVTEVKLIKTRLSLQNIVYLGILYLFLDYTTEIILIKYNNESIQIPTKYFENSLFKDIQELTHKK